MSVRFNFRGLMAPVFTPFDGSKNINFEVIPKYAEYLHSAGIHGVLVNGTTGEGVSLTLKERKDVLEKWMEASKRSGQTVMVQVGGTNLEDVKSLARHAESLQASAILCLADLFFRPTNVDDLLHYLKIVSAQAPRTPLLYYHIPSFTVNMKELLERSAEIPTFGGIKFTDNDLVMGSSCVLVNPKQLVVFLGCDSLFLPALWQGFNSAIATTINIFPGVNVEILKSYKEKNFEKAKYYQDYLNRNILQITQLGPWVSSMKATMTKLSPINVGPVRDPLVNVNPTDLVPEVI